MSNGVPHFVQGICGNKFPTPLATPRGVGESPALVNVIWGWFNFIVGGALLYVGFPPWPPSPAVPLAPLLGALVMAVWLVNHFAKVGSAPHP